MTSVTVRVPAKINLQLAVGPPRPDGYHGLVTVFHAISLFDELTVTPADADRVTVAGEQAGLVPATGDNLALRAVRALRAEQRARAGAAREQCGRKQCGRGPVAVAIAKRIPVAGGMAGGSADAAAALVACNELWGAGLTQAELCAVAGGVGSDVAFAVLGGTAVGRGRGEQLTPAPGRRGSLPLGDRAGRRPAVHAGRLPRAGPAARRRRARPRQRPSRS